MAIRYVVVAMTYSKEVADRIVTSAREADALSVERMELEPGDMLMQWSHVQEALAPYKQVHKEKKE